MTGIGAASGGAGHKRSPEGNAQPRPGEGAGERLPNAYAATRLVRRVTSRLPGFHKMSAAQRRAILQREAGLSAEEAAALTSPLPEELRDGLIENVVGGLTLPIGIATNFVVNDRDVLVPMAIEESSVVAAASNGAKLARDRGGFHARAAPPVMVAQVQLVDVPDANLAQRNLYAVADDIARLAHDASGSLAKRGGGYRGFTIRTVDTEAGKSLVVHVMVDVRDAMGANAVNSVAEAVAPLLAEVTGGRALLRILTNLAAERRVAARASFDVGALGGPQVAADIVRAWAFADADPFRAATHNKGVMNGIDAVVLATGNDWRAVEAGAHAWAARDGRYRSLTRYWIEDDALHGSIELPLALGIVGGLTKVHPAARAALRVLGVKTSGELAEIVASVGLAQNLAALRALAAEGIQQGHMRLHARNLVLAAGVPPERADEVEQKLREEGGVPTQRRAEEIWANLRAESGKASKKKARRAK